MSVVFRFPRPALGVLALTAALSTGLDAQGPPAAPASPADTLLATYKWRSIGPNRGGRSIAVSGVKGRANEAYFGAVGGGLWKTTDAGNNWAPVTDNQITSSSVGAVAVSESNPDVVFIGMGESAIRGNIMPGDADILHKPFVARLQKIFRPVHLHRAPDAGSCPRPPPGSRLLSD